MTKYKAFISYKHNAKNKEKAAAIESALKRYAKPFLAPPLKIFRDEKIVTPSHSLNEEIKKGLENSEYFILLADPICATSKWCQNEVEYWCDKLQKKESLILVILDGDIIIDEKADKINWSKTNCLTPNLEKHITDVPFFIDLRGFEIEKLVLENIKFKDLVNLISAKLRGISPEEINDIEIKTYRKNKRLKRNTIVTLSFLLLAFVIASIYAFTLASINKKEAVGNSMFSKGLIIEKEDPTKALFTINEAYKISKDSSIGNYLLDLYRNEKFYSLAIKTPNYINDFTIINENIVTASNSDLDFYDFDGEKLFRKNELKGKINKIVRDKKDENFYTIGSDSIIAKWSGKGDLLKTFKHKTYVNELDISSNGQIALVDKEIGDRILKVYDNNFNYINQYPIEEGHIFSVQFHPKKDSIIALSNGYNAFSEERYNHVNLLDIKNNTIEKLETNHPPFILKYSKTGKYLASASVSHITIFDFDTRKVIGDFEAHSYNIYDIEFSPDERKLLSSSLNGEIKMWDLEGNILGQYKTSSRASSSIPLMFNNNGTSFVSAMANQKRLNIWDDTYNSECIWYYDKFITNIKIDRKARYSLTSYFGPAYNLILRDVTKDKVISKFNFEELKSFDFINDSLFFINTDERLFIANVLKRKTVDYLDNVFLSKKLLNNKLSIFDKSGMLYTYDVLTKSKDTLLMNITDFKKVRSFEIAKNQKYVAITFQDSTTTIYENKPSSFDPIKNQELNEEFKLFTFEDDTFIVYKDYKLKVQKISGKIISEIQINNLQNIKHSPNSNLLYVSRSKNANESKTRFSIFDYSGNIYCEYEGYYPDDAHLFDVSEDGKYYIITTASGMDDTKVQVYSNVIPIHTFFEKKMIPEFSSW